MPHARGRRNSFTPLRGLQNQTANLNLPIYELIMLPTYRA
jgi:hypothetical protein